MVGTKQKGRQMARGNNRTINVKIPTTKVIKALETKLAQMKADYAKQDENEAKYQKQMDTWRKQVTKFAVWKQADLLSSRALVEGGRATCLPLY